MRAGKRIKVGSSENVNSRVRTFQTGNSEQCEIILTLRLANARTIERDLKDRLNPYQQRGEWFNVSCRKALECLRELQPLFEFDEEPELRLPMERGITLKECHAEFDAWITETFPDGDRRAISDEELWKNFKTQFLTARPEFATRSEATS
jgi:hypothetical protein